MNYIEKEISIITPSYNMLEYLKLCAASVADQQGVECEHIIVDGMSTDGTAAWLSSQSGIRYISEPDNGMYDAINKGLKSAKGDILAYLNCDEQYLPGILSFVKDYFNNHPDVDVLFGDFLAVNPDGSLVSYRKAFQPRRLYIEATHLYVFTCTMFFRRKIIDNNIYFDTIYKSISDSIFTAELLKRGYKAKHLKKYLAVFIMTGNNDFLTKKAVDEQRKYISQNRLILPKLLHHPINFFRIAEKVIHGCYYQKFPLKYSIYLNSYTNNRKEITAVKGTPFWRLQ